MQPSNMALPTQIDVRVGNSVTTVDTGSLIGGGGEGVVAKISLGSGQYAVKIILPVMRNRLRFDKLKAQIGRVPPMPNRTVKPLELVYDDRTGELIGFAMELLDVDQYDELTFWLDPVWRADNDVTFEEVVQIFYELREELEMLHGAGYTIGDFNPGGVLILKKHLWNATNQMQRLRVVDADCCAFDRFPCLVYTLAYLDPNIQTRQANDGQLELKETFRPEHDLFAFDALFFQALTTANVWDGYHPTFQMNAKINFKKGWTVLHDDVDYPQDALPFEDLPPTFQDKFVRSFVHGERELFPVHFLEDALGIAGSFTLRRRQSTPTVSDIMVSLFETYFDNLDNIVDTEVVDGALYVLDKSDDGVYTYHSLYMGNHKAYVIPNTNPNCTYRILDKGFVIEYQPPVDRKFAILYIFDVHTGERHHVTSSTGIQNCPIVAGGGGRVMFTDAKNYLRAQYITAPEQVTALKTINRNVEIKSDMGTGNVCGYIRTMDLYSWFFIRGDLAYDIPNIAQLEPAEYMRDWAVRFYKNRAILLRLTEFKGQLRTRIDEVNLSSTFKGKDRLVLSREPHDGELFKPLDGCEYGFDSGTGEGVILYATDGGIVRENLNTGEVVLLDQTDNLVQRGMKLRRHGYGMLAIGRNRIDYIEI